MNNFDIEELDNNQKEQLSFENVNFKQFSISHSEKYERTKRLYNNIIDLQQIIDRDFPQIVGSEVDGRIAYQNKIREYGFDEYFKSIEVAFGRNEDDTNIMQNNEIQPDSISPNQHLVYLYEFETLEELNKWVQTGQSKYEQDELRYQGQIASQFDEHEFKKDPTISCLQSAVKIICTPAKSVLSGTARKELSIHKSDAQEFEDLFGFRPNQKEYGVGNHNAERNKVKQEASQGFHNIMRGQIVQALRQMMEHRVQLLNQMNELINQNAGLADRYGGEFQNVQAGNQDLSIQLHNIDHLMQQISGMELPFEFNGLQGNVMVVMESPEPNNQNENDGFLEIIQNPNSFSAPANLEPRNNQMSPFVSLRQEFIGLNEFVREEVDLGSDRQGNNNLQRQNQQNINNQVFNNQDFFDDPNLQQELQNIEINQSLNNLPNSQGVQSNDQNQNRLPHSNFSNPQYARNEPSHQNVAEFSFGNNSPYQNNNMQILVNSSQDPNVMNAPDNFNVQNPFNSSRNCIKSLPQSYDNNIHQNFDNQSIPNNFQNSNAFMGLENHQNHANFEFFSPARNNLVQQSFNQISNQAIRGTPFNLINNDCMSPLINDFNALQENPNNQRNDSQNNSFLQYSNDPNILEIDQNSQQFSQVRSSQNLERDEELFSRHSQGNSNGSRNSNFITPMDSIYHESVTYNQNSSAIPFRRNTENHGSNERNSINVRTPWNHSQQEEF